MTDRNIPVLKVRASRQGDMPAMLAAYGAARSYMREHGNTQQWIGGHPSVGLLQEDIAAGRSYVITEGGNDPVVGTFCFFVGEEPTYKEIEGRGWLDEAPYGVIHRLASTGTHRGVLDAALAYAFSCCPNLRVDTHRDNSTMLTALTRRGFTRCGIIRLADTSLRIAFQKRVAEDPM